MDKRILVAVALCWIGCEKQTEIVIHQGYALGTSFSVQYAPVDHYSYDDVQQGMDSLFYVINASLSTYLPASVISKINQGDSLVRVDKHFQKVFAQANHVWSTTKGYFDPTVGAWVNAYGFGPDKPLVSINQQQRDSLMQITGWDKIQLTSDQRVRKEKPEIYIDFNALAKGYTVDVIAAYLSQLGSQNHLVEIGGEVVAKGVNPTSGEAWKIGIDKPNEAGERSLQSILTLSNEALATSGNYRKFRVDEATGEKYVHSINPLNGTPVRSKVLSVSVKAHNCMLADAYATALMVMPFDQGKALIESNNSLSAYWILSSNEGQFQEVFSSRWYN